MGVAIPGNSSPFNTVGHQRLASLLNLPAPGEPARPSTRVDQVSVTVQFRFTGPGGCEWYLLCDKGKATKFDGCAENPNCTLIVSAEDWDKMLRGELEKFKAWTDGKLKIEGDMNLFMQLEDTISKFTKGGG
jgi:putative sterol carrier protein